MSRPSLDSILVAQQQWEEAIAEGPTAAEVAARRAFTICADAIDQLRHNLDREGYPRFDFRVPCSDRLEERLARAEHVIAEPVPPVLTAFWRIVGGVDFIKDRSHAQFWYGVYRDGMDDEVARRRRVHGQLCECDGLVIDPCNDEWVTWAGWLFRENSRPGESLWGPSLPFSVDAIHKEGFSGGAEYGLILDDPWAPTVDELVLYPRSSRLVRGPVKPGATYPQADFLTYLRSALLEFSGFPGLFAQPQGRGPHPLLHRILEGVPVF